MFSVYTIYDKKANLYSTPIYERNNATMIRACEQSYNDVESPYHQYAEDYDVYLLGTYDEEKGRIVVLDNSNFVLNFGAFFDTEKASTVMPDESFGG